MTNTAPFTQQERAAALAHYSTMAEQAATLSDQADDVERRLTGPLENYTTNDLEAVIFRATVVLRRREGEQRRRQG